MEDSRQQVKNTETTKRETDGKDKTVYRGSDIADFSAAYMALVWLEYGFFENWWIRTACCFFAAFWLLLFRPWQIFRDRKSVV